MASSSQSQSSVEVVSPSSSQSSSDGRFVLHKTVKIWEVRSEVSVTSQTVYKPKCCVMIKMFTACRVHCVFQAGQCRVIKQFLHCTKCCVMIKMFTVFSRLASVV